MHVKSPDNVKKANASLTELVFCPVMLIGIKVNVPENRATPVHVEDGTVIDA